MLTDRQRHRLAREARKLAMECVEGTAPEFTPNSFCGCAIGHTVKRAIPARYVGKEKASGVRFQEFYSLCREIDDLLPMSYGFYGLGMVSRSIQHDFNQDNGAHSAVVFPLLALADAIEAGPRAAPSPTPNTRKER